MKDGRILVVYNYIDLEKKIFTPKHTLDKPFYENIYDLEIGDKVHAYHKGFELIFLLEREKLFLEFGFFEKSYLNKKNEIIFDIALGLRQETGSSGKN